MIVPNTFLWIPSPKEKHCDSYDIHIMQDMSCPITRRGSRDLFHVIILLLVIVLETFHVDVSRRTDAECTGTSNPFALDLRK